MTAFESATALTPEATVADGATFTWDVPDGWQQGRGAWGGLVVGAVVGAVTLTEPDDGRRARTLSVQISRPAMVGPHHVRVRAARIGSRVSTWEVAVTDADDAVVADATVIAGRARPGAADRDEVSWGPVPPPDVAPAAEVPVLTTGPPFPVFTQHCTFGVVDGMPMQGERAETLGWIGYREPPPWTEASVLALADAWYPVGLVPLREFVPMGTVNFTANLVIDPASLVPGDPLVHHAVAGATHDGYASELRRLWTAGGRLAVENLQTIVIG